MNGLRTWILHDLPHAIPSNGLKQSASRVHTSPSSRRFWSFFEFTGKEEAGSTAKQCPAAKDAVPPSLMPSSQMENLPIARIASLPRTASMAAAMALGNRPQHPCVFDATNVSRTVGQPSLLKHDELTSLLDGNPVPRTLKWKLKGYKTLRHEQAGDFAFVPGGKSYDLDVFPRTDWTTGPEIERPPRSAQRDATGGPPDECRALSLTTKAIENKRVEVEDRLAKSEPEADEKPGCLLAESKTNQSRIETELESSASPNPEVVAEVSRVEPRQNVGKTRSSIPRLLSKSTTVPTGQKIDARKPNLIASTLTSGQDPGLLPAAKPETSTTSRFKCQSQPSVKYSSRPPRKLPKPSPPSSNRYTPSAPTVPTQPTQPTQPAAPVKPSPSLDASSGIPEAVEPRFPAAADVPRDTPARNVANDIPSTTTYFAPLPSRRAPSRSNDFTLSSSISRPREPRTTISPCAATLVRTTLARRAQAPASAGWGNLGNPGNPGNPRNPGNHGGSGNGSRKPPSSCPPPAPRRASSSGSYGVLEKPSVREDAPQGAAKTRNSTVNISTTAANSVPKRRCEDDDAAEGRLICTKPRQNESCENDARHRDSCDRPPKCERERPRRKKKKKVCKRFKCPQLRGSRECEFVPSVCPKRGRKNRDRCEDRQRDAPCKKPATPTCNEARQQGGREICTDPTRGSCNRRNRRAACPDRENQCRRNRRDGSCEREQRKCPQNRGRVICTDPGRRSCNRRNSRGGGCDRSANRTGRRRFSQLAFFPRAATAAGGVRRFSSLPTVEGSLTGLRVPVGRTSRRSYGCKERFFGKKKSKSPPVCKDGNPPTKKCKKGPAKCLNRPPSSDTCKTEPPKCQPSCKAERIERIERTECKQWTSEKKVPACKAERARPTTCQTPTASSKACGKGGRKGDESTKERTQRELKEMQRCKKGLNQQKSKKLKKRKAEGKSSSNILDRVISPCKKRQLQNPTGNKCSRNKFSRASSGLATWNRCLNLASILARPNGNGSTSGCFDRSYFTTPAPPAPPAPPSRDSDDTNVKTSTSGWKDFWNLTGNGDHPVNEHEEIPLPIVIEHQDEEPDDASSRNN